MTDRSETSALWGHTGEEWTPDNRLPDVSAAGYRRGQTAIPTVEIVANVRDFGAVGDGEADDTAAIQAAIEATETGAIRFPAGTYRVTDRLRIEQPGIVLRGDGSARTRLRFPRPLNEIDPNWGSTAGGQRTSNYSWSGGFIHVEGSYGTERLATITGSADRGAQTIETNGTRDLSVGMEIEIHQSDTADQSLCRHLYADDPGDISDIEDDAEVSLVTTVTEIDGDRVRFDRPLRFDVCERWSPVIRRWSPTVTEVGIERLGIDFPAVPYEGHFSELGYNPLTFVNTANCWARDLHLHNADNGPMVAGRFCTIDGLTLTSTREPTDGCVGHHGIYLQDDDNCYRNFTYHVSFVHDISVTHAAGNVITSGRGVDLNLDNHRWHPYGNVFTDIHCGAAERVWDSSGGHQRGRHGAARTTFWNIRGDRPIPPVPDDWGTRVNVIGITTEDTSPRTDPEADLWWEPIDPDRLHPRDIYEAQRDNH